MNEKLILPNTQIPVVISSSDNKHFCIEGDTSKTAGILHFSHEWAINFTVLKNGKIKFTGGWEIACEDIDYGPNDRDYFEYLHPGVLEDLQTVMEEQKWIN